MSLIRLGIGFSCMAALLAGCNPEPSAAGKNPGPATPAGNGADKAKPGSAEGAELTLDKIPADLKTDAFEYYGLSKTDEVNSELTVKGKPPITAGTKTGSQKFKLIEIGQDSAKFSVTFTGATAQLGDLEATLKKDGIYVTMINGKTLDKPSLELPADLTPGKRWNSSLPLSTPNGEAKLEATYKVTGIEKVKTKVGEFDALRVDGVNKTTVGGKTYSSTVTGWYVKGTGQVRTYVKGLPGDPNGTLTQEIVK